MRRLKPAPDPWIDLPVSGGHASPSRGRGGRWLEPRPSPRPRLNALAGVGLAVGLVWGAITLPFRVVFGVLGLLGRLAALVVGFALMVFGAALLPGPLVIVGVPLFAIGLLLSMRSLG